MKTLFQINSTSNWGSTGRIAEDIGRTVMSQGWESYIAYGRYSSEGLSRTIQIGSQWDTYNHVLQSRLLDNHGLASKVATRKLIQKIDEIKPDIIHLHNIHGYYLNYELLFKALSDLGVPVVWTLHDCWAFTGHCAHFSFIGCDKWKSGCFKCPQLKNYPASYLLDRSQRNYRRKKNSFTSLKNLTLVPVSDWLAELLESSFLRKYAKCRIYNGVNLDVFCPKPSLIKEKLGISSGCMLLGVASVWGRRKGLDDFITLRGKLPDDYTIVLVGLTTEQIKTLPQGILGISRTTDVNELAELYSAADIFINPTWEDNFPTTNLEALACGTPVITYRTGGSVEAVDEVTGRIVEQGDMEALIKAIKELKLLGKENLSKACREKAVICFDKQERFQEYLDLYEKLLNF